MRFGGPPAERHRGAQIPVLERGEERRRLPVARLEAFLRVLRLTPVGPLHPGGHALVVAAQLVNRELPSGALMLDHTLDDGARAGIDPRTQVRYPPRTP